MSKSLFAIGNQVVKNPHYFACPQFHLATTSYPEPVISNGSFPSNTQNQNNLANLSTLCTQNDIINGVSVYETISRRPSIASISSVHLMEEPGLDKSLIDIHETSQNSYPIHIHRMSNVYLMDSRGERDEVLGTMEQSDIGFSVPSQDFQVPESIALEDYYNAEKTISLHHLNSTVSSMTGNLDDQTSSDNSSPGFLDLGDYFECPDALSTDTYLKPEVVDSSMEMLIPSQIVSSASVKSHFFVNSLLKDSPNSTASRSTHSRKHSRSQKSTKYSIYGNIPTKQTKCKRPSSIQQCTSSNERPYTCEYCGHCFARKHDMLRHRRKHTGQKPYSCDSCGESFYRTDVRQRHYQNEPKCWAEMMRTKSLVYHY